MFQAVHPAGGVRARPLSSAVADDARRSTTSGKCGCGNDLARSRIVTPLPLRDTGAVSTPKRKLPDVGVAPMLAGQ